MRCAAYRFAIVVKVGMLCVSWREDTN
jgi:hypothetical protein